MIKRILVVDDDEAVRKAFLLALEDTEFHTDAAVSGVKGLEMMNQVDYDLVFLDLKMPDMDGIQTLKSIRAKTKAIPVYVITAFSGEYFDQLAEIKKDGIDFELLKKPIGAGQILEVIRGILEGEKP